MVIGFFGKKINASSPALYALVDQNQDTRETYVMNIIRQKNTENELHNIVHQFTSLIGLSKLIKLVNYRRNSEISLMKVIEWLLTTKFLGRLLYRAHETPNFTSRTVRNNLNDGRINWQRLICQVGSHLIKHLRPFIDRRRLYGWTCERFFGLKSSVWFVGSIFICTPKPEVPASSASA